MNVVYWLTVIILIIALSFPRRYMHMIGAVGIALMTVSVWGNWPMVFLNICTSIMHVAMMIKFWNINK